MFCNRLNKIMKKEDPPVDWSGGKQSVRTRKTGET